MIVDKNTRNKKKAITTVYGLDGFGVKLAEAAKLCGKKFASGAAVVKSPSEKDQIDIQGDCLERVRIHFCQGHWQHCTRTSSSACVWAVYVGNTLAYIIFCWTCQTCRIGA